MNTKERYDELITFIEDRIQQCDGGSAASIAEEVAHKAGYSARGMGEMFDFLTGQSLKLYIKERQMMCAYQILLKQEEFDAEEAMRPTTYGDQAAFNNAFKKRFSMTPKEVQMSKNREGWQRPYTWDIISSQEREPDARKEKRTEKKKRYLTQEEREKMEEVERLQKAYKFNEAQTEAALELAERFKEERIPLKKAFGFIYEICQGYLCGIARQVNIEDKARLLRKALKYKNLFILYGRYGYSFVDMDDMRKYFKEEDDEELREMDPDWVAAFWEGEDEYEFLDDLL